MIPPQVCITIILSLSCYSQVFIVGKDFGAWPAYYFALLYPERVLGVATLGIPFIPPGPVTYSKYLPEGFYFSRWKVSSCFLSLLCFKWWNNISCNLGSVPLQFYRIIFFAEIMLIRILHIFIGYSFFSRNSFWEDENIFSIFLSKKRSLFKNHQTMLKPSTRRC